MPSFVGLLFYNSLKSEDYFGNTQQYTSLKKITFIIMVGISCKNIINLIHENYLNEYIDKERGIQNWVISILSILITILYKLVENIQKIKHTNGKNSVLLIIFFIIEIVFNYTSINEIKIASEGYQFNNPIFEGLWLGINLMIWIIFVQITTNLFCQIFIMLAVVILCSVLSLNTKNSILYVIKAIIMMMTLISVSYLTLRNKKKSSYNKASFENESIINKKILDSLPESFVVVTNTNMAPLYYNDSFKNLVGSKLPKNNDVHNLISNINCLKSRDDSGILIENSSDDEENVIDKIVKLMNYKEVNNPIFNFGEEDINFVNNSHFVHNSSMNGIKSLLSIINKRKSFKNDEKKLSIMNADNNSKRATIILPQINPKRTYLKSKDEFLDPDTLQNLDGSTAISKKDINLFHIVDYIKDKWCNTDNDSNKYSIVVFQGKLEEKHLEIKIIRFLHNNTISLLLFFNDITANILKTKIEYDKECKSLLLSSLSHKIKTLLNGSIAIMQSALDDQNTPKETAKQFLLPSLTISKCLFYFVNNILDYSQILTNKLVMDFKNVNIKELTYNVVEIIEFYIKKKDLIKLKVNIDDSVPENFKTDPGRYSQILLCLLENAYKFTFLGEIKLTIKYNNLQNILKVSVQDTGIGMTTETLTQLKKIFEISGPDFIHKNFSNESISCALGLSIASALAKYLGPLSEQQNNLDVKSVEGKGSKFSLRLQNKNEGSYS